MKTYIYIRAVAKNADPNQVSFTHRVIKARDKRDAYRVGTNWPKMTAWCEANQHYEVNDYAIRVKLKVSK